MKVDWKDILNKPPGLMAFVTSVPLSLLDGTGVSDGDVIQFQGSSFTDVTPQEMLNYLGTDLDLSVGLKVDTIDEHTSSAGVTVEDVQLKDGHIYLSLGKRVYLNGGTTDSILSNGGTITTISGGDTVSIGSSSFGWTFYIRNLLADFEIVNSLGNDVFRVSNFGVLEIDTITELTTDAGVTIEGILLKDGGMTLTDGVPVEGFLDEDDMASDSASHAATQQSIKAYVDAASGGGGLSALEAAMSLAESRGGKHEIYHNYLGTQTAGSGSAIYWNPPHINAQLKTGTTVNSRISGIWPFGSSGGLNSWGQFNKIDWSKPLILTFNISCFWNAGSSTVKFLVGIGQSAGNYISSATLTVKGVGILFDDNGIYGVVHDGTTENVVSLGTCAKYKKYGCVIYNKGDGDVEFWAFDDSNQTNGPDTPDLTISTNSPSGTGSSGYMVPYFYLTNGATTVNEQIHFNNISVYFPE
jgi:hypothetical protein